LLFPAVEAFFALRFGKPHHVSAGDNPPYGTDPHLQVHELTVDSPLADEETSVFQFDALDPLATLGRFFHEEDMSLLPFDSLLR